MVGRPERLGGGRRRACKAALDAGDKRFEEMRRAGRNGKGCMWGPSRERRRRCARRVAWTRCGRRSSSCLAPLGMPCLNLPNPRASNPRGAKFLQRAREGAGLAQGQRPGARAPRRPRRVSPHLCASRAFADPVQQPRKQKRWPACTCWSSRRCCWRRRCRLRSPRARS